MIRIIVSIILLIPFFIQAQEEIKWGKISDFEKSYMECDFDPEADAVILANEGNTYFQFIGGRPKVYHHRHTRIKILKESGEKHADVRLGFHIDHDISKLKAQTITPEGKRIKLRRSEIFKDELDDETRTVSFSLPQIEVGSIIEFQYVLETENIFTLPTWYFNKEISTLKSHLTVDLPPYYEYAHIHTNGLNIFQHPPQVFHDARVGMDVTRYLFQAEKLPGIKEEKYITTVYDHYTSTTFQLQTIKYPNQPVEKILVSWNELANKLRDYDMLGDQYVKERKSKDASEALLSQVNTLPTKVEQINKLYDMLNEQMKWDGEYAAFASDDLDKVFEKKIGNSADLNLLFISLVRQLKIPAYPVLISTRSHGASMELYPIVNQFNHVLACIELEGQELLYDVSSKFRPYQCLRFNALNKKGWLIKDDSQKWIPIQAEKGSDIIVLQAELLPEEGIISGALTAKYSGMNTIPERIHYDEDTKGVHWQERFKESYQGVEVISATPEHLNDLTKDFKEEVNLKMEGGFIQMDSFIYFSPITYSSFKDNPFKQEVRHCPVDFGFPVNETLIFNYVIPANYSVEELPENSIITLDKNGGKYTYMVSFNASNNILQVMSKIDIDKIEYAPASYKYIKDFFGHIKDKMEEQVVLKKI